MTVDVGVEILRKLDVLIAVTATAVLEGKPQREKIEVLDRAGLAPKDIAQVVGITSNNVRATLTKLRSREKKKTAK